MGERYFIKHLVNTCSSEMRSILSNKIKLVPQIYLRTSIHDSTSVTQNHESQDGCTTKPLRYVGPRGDHAFKRLFTRSDNKVDLIGFLGKMLVKCEDKKMMNVLRMDTENMPRWEGKKCSILDIKCLGRSVWKQGWYEGKKGLGHQNVYKSNISIPFSRNFHGSAMQEDKFFDPMYDAAFKKVFGSDQSTDVSISFINSMLKFEGERKVSKILQLSVDDTKNKSTSLHIFCEDQNGDRFMIELQRGKEHNYIERTQYYLANRFGTQLGKFDPISEIKAYYMISVLKDELFPHDEAVSVFSIKDTVHLDDTSHDKLQWIYVELSKVERWKWLKGHEDAKEWLDFLSKASELHEMPEGVMPEIKRAYELVEERNATEEERKEIMEQKEREWRFTEFVERQKYYSKKEGIEEGKKEGIEEGKKEGREIIAKTVAKRMLAQGVSIETIQSFTELSKEQIQVMKDDMDSER